MDKNIKNIKNLCITNFKIYQTKINNFNKTYLNLKHVTILNTLTNDDKMKFILTDNLIIVRNIINIMTCFSYFGQYYIYELSIILFSIILFSHNNLFMDLTPYFLKFDAIHSTNKYINLRTNNLVKERNIKFIIIYTCIEMINVFGFFKMINFFLNIIFIDISSIINLCTITFFSIISVSSILSELSICNVPEPIYSFIQSYRNNKSDAILQGIVRPCISDLDDFYIDGSELNIDTFDTFNRLHLVMYKQKVV